MKSIAVLALSALAIVLEVLLYYRPGPAIAASVWVTCNVACIIACSKVARTVWLPLVLSLCGAISGLVVFLSSWANADHSHDKFGPVDALILLSVFGVVYGGIAGGVVGLLVMIASIVLKYTRDHWNSRRRPVVPLKR